MNDLLSIPSIASPPLNSSNSSNTSTKVILIRHARTTYNEQGRYQGSSDFSVLTEQGYQDAYATGLALQQYNFDAIYTSPLTRVQQTAQEISSALNSADIPVYVESRLTEVCMSDWQGLSYKEVKKTYPDDYHCWQSTPHLFTRNGVNFPVLELFAQAKAFWQQILNKHRGQTILIVAHGGTNRALIGSAIALAPKHYHTLQQCNCGISCLEFSVASNLGKLKFLNITQHLGKHLPKLKAGKTGWRWLLLSNKMAEDRLNNSHLSKLFEQNLINLVLTEDSDRSKELADNLTKENKEVLGISINSSIFLQSWHQTIVAKQKDKDNSQAAELFTGLIIAPDRLIARIMHQTIDANSALDLRNCLAVVHYPQGERRSILQGILPLISDLAEKDFQSLVLRNEEKAIAS